MVAGGRRGRLCYVSYRNVEGSWVGSKNGKEGRVCCRSEVEEDWIYDAQDLESGNKVRERENLLRI